MSVIMRILQNRFFYIIIFLSIFLLGLAMRSPELIAGNYLFGFDQGQNYIAATSIANGKFTLIGAEVGSGAAGVPGLFHGPGFYYVLALVIKLFGNDPYWGLVLMWVGGVVTMILAYLIAYKIFGKYAALVVLFLVSTAPLIAPQSRFMWGPHLGTILILLVYYCFYKIPDKPNLYTPLAVFFSGLLYHFELAIAVPLVITTFIITIFPYRVLNLKVFIVSVFACCFAFAPAMLFEVRHDFMATRGVIKHINNPSVVKEASPEGDKKASVPHSAFLKQHTDMFWFNFRDTFVFESGLISQQYFVITLYAIAGCILLAFFTTKDKRQRQFFIALYLVIPISYLVFVPLKNNIWHYYLIHLYFIHIFAVGFAWSIIVPRIKRFPLFTLASLFLVFFLLSITKGTSRRLELNWQVDFHDYGGHAKILGKKHIIDRVYKDANGQPFSLHIFVPPVYTYAYDYLLSTYAMDKYGYIPSREKTGTGYLIIEIDGEKPWSYKGWLETVIVSGTPVWEEYDEKSDHVLQKRIF